MEIKSKHDSVIELVNKLFVYTDFRLWEKLQADIFQEKVRFDMSSMGGGAPTEMTAIEICKMWETGFTGIDHIHHQSGNFIVNFKSDIEADVFCYAVAYHYKNSATKGKTREFVGSYDIHCVLTDKGWRIDGFRYTLKYVNGNQQLT
jgi:hypothetical protein